MQRRKRPRRRDGRWRLPRLPRRVLAGYLSLLLLTLGILWWGSPHPEAVPAMGRRPEPIVVPDGESGAPADDTGAPPAADAGATPTGEPGTRPAGDPTGLPGNPPETGPSYSQAWWEGWWTRPDVARLILQMALPKVGAAPVHEQGLDVDAGDILDFLVWIFGGIRLTDPVSLLRHEIPGLDRVEIAEAAEPVTFSWPSPFPRILPPAGPEDQGPRDFPARRQLEPESRPLVLIYHTHSQESYYPALGAGAQSPYTRDPSRSIVRAGEEMAWTLQEMGVPVYHLTTPFDREGMIGAYLRSERGVQVAMSRYPSIQVLLDVHRDSASRQVTTLEVDGQRLAKVMFVLGTNRRLPHPDWRRNQAFADALARIVEKRYPGLVRKLDDGDDDPLTYAKADRYNQHLSRAAILIEIGGPENTLDEVLRSAQIVAAAVAGLVQSEQLVRITGE